MSSRGFNNNPNCYARRDSYTSSTRHGSTRSLPYDINRHGSLRSMRSSRSKYSM